MTTQWQAETPAGPPADLVRQRYPFSVLNMSTGPVHVTDAVLRASLDGYISSHSAQFWKTHTEVTQMLSQVFRTQQPVLALHGSIRTGLELCLRNLVQPQDKVLVLCNGFWGDYLAQNAAEFSRRVVRVESSPFLPFDVQKLEQALRTHEDVRLVVAVHVETNTGVVNDARAIAAATRRAGALSFIDTACSVGCMAVPMDDWGIDVCATGSHKTLAGLPGLALLSLSRAAMQRVQDVGEAAGAPALSRLSALFERCLRPGAAPSYTHSTSLLLSLHAALRERLAPGLAHWEEHSAHCAAQFRQAARAAGIGFATDHVIAPGQEEGRLSSTVMAVQLPDGVSEARVRARMEQVHGIFVIGNVGQLAGKSVRIGLMSPVQMDRRNWGATIGALNESINHCRNSLEHTA